MQPVVPEKGKKIKNWKRKNAEGLCQKINFEMM
jgi:hypothetical protein